MYECICSQCERNLEDCTGGDLASGEGIYKAECARDAISKAAALVGDDL